MSVAVPGPWVVCAGLAAIAVLAALSAIVVCIVVRKARAEDLPQILAGLSQMIEATAGFLPWHRMRASRALRTPLPKRTSAKPYTVNGNFVIVRPAPCLKAQSKPRCVLRMTRPSRPPAAEVNNEEASVCSP